MDGSIPHLVSSTGNNLCWECNEIEIMAKLGWVHTFRDSISFGSTTTNPTIHSAPSYHICGHHPNTIPALHPTKSFHSTEAHHTQVVRRPTQIHSSHTMVHTGNATLGYPKGLRLRLETRYRHFICGHHPFSLVARYETKRGRDGTYGRISSAWLQDVCQGDSKRRSELYNHHAAIDLFPGSRLLEAIVLFLFFHRIGMGR